MSLVSPQQKLERRCVTAEQKYLSLVKEIGDARGGGVGGHGKGHGNGVREELRPGSGAEAGTPEGALLVAKQAWQRSRELSLENEALRHQLERANEMSTSVRRMAGLWLAGSLWLCAPARLAVLRERACCPD